MNDSPVNLEAEDPFRLWPRGLAWPAFALLAWVVFELTANAALGVVVFLRQIWLERPTHGGLVAAG